MGTLPGWWLAQKDGRTWGPLLSKEAWHAALRRNGFSDYVACVQDFEDRTIQGDSVLVVRKIADVNETKESLPQRLESFIPDKLIIATDSPKSALVQNIKRNLVSSSYAESDIVVLPLSEVPAHSFDGRTDSIVLTEVEKPLFFGGVSTEALQGLQHLVRHCNTISWVTQVNIIHSNFFFVYSNIISYHRKRLYNHPNPRKRLFKAFLEPFGLRTPTCVSELLTSRVRALPTRMRGSSQTCI